MSQYTRLINKTLNLLYSLLFFLTPLVFFPKTSELFEFNKIIVLYFITILVGAIWLAHMALTKKLIFRSSLLDAPLVLFLLSMSLSTVLSIDTRTSLLGYYSRFNGGLISLVCFSLLYWAYVAHMSASNAKKHIIILIIATAVASVWGILEHLGHSPSCLIIANKFDNSCWVQDVQLRVYATFGQPNWMAAWIAAIIPVSFSLLNKAKTQKNKLITTIFISLATAAIIFTKSRSGLFSLIVATGLFSLLSFLSHYAQSISVELINLKKSLKPILLASFLTLAYIFFIGIQVTPYFQRLLTENNTQTTREVTTPALESGGTESGTIRQIVWTGAINVWKQFPLLGSGLETFAFSYYRGRPVEHNLTSEWNFIYNKAHNEYLNYLATTGLIGLSTYLVLIVAILVQLYRNKNQTILRIGLLAGFISILITNFFGFSVVPTSLLFFLFPAFAIALQNKEKEDNVKKEEFTTAQVSFFVAIALSGCVLLYLTYSYWKADFLYARSKEDISAGEYSSALANLNEAISRSPYESLYHSDLADMLADVAAATTDKELSDTYALSAISEIKIAQGLSPSSVRNLKSLANTYATLGEIDPNYYLKTLELTQTLLPLAPTDPSVHYQRALTLAKIAAEKEAIKEVNEAISLKPNYKIARQLAAYLYKATDQKQKAAEEYEYILKYIAPDDENIKKELKNLQEKGSK